MPAAGQRIEAPKGQIKAKILRWAHVHVRGFAVSRSTPGPLRSMTAYTHHMPVWPLALVLARNCNQIISLPHIYVACTSQRSHDY